MDYKAHAEETAARYRSFSEVTKMNVVDLQPRDVNLDAERSRLEREVVERVKKWNATNHRDTLAVERALTELGDAVDALLDFETKTGNEVSK